MSDIWTQLAEAKIRDWQRREAAGETVPAPPKTLDGDSWEAQMFKQILAHREAAAECADDEGAALLRQKAEHLRIQLMAMLERDRPLLAQVLAAKLAAHLMSR